MSRLVAEAEQQKPGSSLARRITLGVILIISLGLFALWRVDSPRVEQVRMAVADALLPSLDIITQPIEFMTEMARDFRNFVDVYNQNRTLRREIQRLRGWRATARSLEEENAQLRALNKVQLRPKTTFVTGDVVTDSGGPFTSSALVNVGRRDGITDGAAAVDGEGLAGRVVGVGERASRLLLLTDYSSRVPVIVQPAGIRAVLAGDGTNLPNLEFLVETDKIKPGNAIETTGDGGVFPPNLPVGWVVRTRNSGLRARLAADYSRMEFVRVLRYRPDTEIDQPGGLILPPGHQDLIGPPAPEPAPEDAPTGEN